MKKATCVGLVFALLYGTGAFWSALQTAAWTRMVAQRASESSWAQAVASTFSGARPCRACRVVARASDQKMAPQGLLPSSHSEVFAFSPIPEFLAPSPAQGAFVDVPCVDGVFATCPDAPPPESARVV